MTEMEVSATGTIRAGPMASPVVGETGRMCIVQGEEKQSIQCKVLSLAR